MSDDERMDRAPRTDPTSLTTDALENAVAGLKELLGQSVTHESELRVKDIEALERELFLLDKQRVEGKAADSASLAAALSAAKEAVRENNLSFSKEISKTENATNDQIKSMVTTFNTAIESVNNTISDAKDRINKLEQAMASHAAAEIGQEKGGDRQQKAESDKVAWGFAAFSAIGLAVSVIIQLSH